MTVSGHLEELRRVLIVSIAAVVVFAAGAYVFSPQVMDILLSPITSAGHQPVVTAVTEAFMTRIKLSLFMGFLAGLPIILWQVWSFVSPALEGTERRYCFLFVFGSFFLFLGGVAFGFFGVYKYAVAFLLKFAGDQLVPMLTIDKYISFTIYLLIPFGVIFQLPLASFLLARLGLISSAFLAKNRRYALFGTVVLAAAITPTPDIITCLMMTGPMYGLYEVSVLIVRFTERALARKKAREEAEEAEASKPAANRV
ncbi:MAG TPA: twin-arginine translocase subunit TatC [Desulfotomaculum sp.]|nr:twin-arginine translocase subunit TatC [Desulfotomaculum sp.]